MNSFLMLQGLETLAPRMNLHCANASKLAEFLATRAEVAWVNYPGLSSSPYFDRVNTQFGGSGGGLLTLGLGSRERAFKFLDSVRLAKNMTNLGDAKTLVVHPASTIFHEYAADERAQLGVPDDMVRVSAGIEDFEDIRDDFEQALDATNKE
jgi:O-acetylhomoserine (thiol)-lyase